MGATRKIRAAAGGVLGDAIARQRGDSDTGELSASGEAVTKADRKLLKAINNKKIKVTLEATSSNEITLGNQTKDLVVGAFLGSKKDENGIVNADAAINPNQASKASELYNEAGDYVIHEIIESYDAAKKSPDTEQYNWFDELNNTKKYKKFKKAFDKAHRRTLRFQSKSGFIEPLYIQYQEGWNVSEYFENPNNNQKIPRGREVNIFTKTDN